MEHKLLRIPTGGRLTVGYLHNGVEEMNSGLPRTNPDSSWVEELNQGSYRLLQALTGTLSILSINIFTAFCQKAKTKHKYI